MSKDIENITQKNDDGNVENEKVYSLPYIKPKKNKFKQFIKYAFITFLIYFAFFTAVIFFIQTSFFKNKALQYVVGILNENLVTKETVISAESIDGNILNGLSLSKVSIVTKKDTLLKFDKIELEYSLFRLMNKQIYVNNLVLFRPQINFTKIHDKNDSLIWNFEYVLKPEKPKEIDTAKKEFDWGIEVKNLVIFRCNFRMLENKGSDLPIREIKMPDNTYLDISNLDVKDFTLTLSAHYFPDEKFVNIKNFSLKTNSDMNVKMLSLEAYLHKNNTAEVKYLNLETDRSRIKINEAKLENLNPFKEKIVYEDFKEKEMSVDIITDKFDSDDLRFFLKDLNFLDGRVYLDLKAKGKYGNFLIEKLNLNTGKSKLDISGRVMNLENPSKLLLDVKVKNAELDPYDTKEILPGIPIPDYTNIGKIYADFTFKGEPIKFDSEFDVRTSVGDVKGKTFLDITQKELVYKSDFTTKNLDIGKIIKDDKYKSNITSTIVTEGRGVDYRTMVNKINFEINNTTFLGQNISKSNGVINSNNGSFDLNLEYSSNSLSTKMEGNVDVKDLSNIKYNVKGIAQNLDISTFTENPGDKSNLNFDFNLQGVGYDPDRILGNLQFNISPSQYSDYLIPGTPLTVTFEQDGEQRKITMTSDILNLDARGKFSFNTLPLIITSNLNEIIAQIKAQYETDTLLLAEHNTFTINNSSITSNSGSILPDMNLVYKLSIKDLTPIVHYTKDSNFTFSADIKGSMKNDVNNFSFNASGDINNFQYGDSNIRFTKGKISFDLSRGYFPYKNGFISSSLDLNINKFSKDSLVVDSLGYKMVVNDNRNNFSIYGIIDTNNILNTAGSFAFGGKYITLLIDTLGAKYYKYKLGNLEKMKIAYKPGDNADTVKVIRFDNIKIATPDNQRLDVDGYYALNGISDLNLSLHRIKISDLQDISFSDIEDEDIIKGNLRRLKLNYTGTPADPHFYVEANTDVLSLQKYKLGRLDAIIDYKNDIAKPEISFYNPNNEGKLLISGNVPYINPMKPIGEGEQKQNFLEGNINLNILASNFQIKILEQLIPVLSELRGNMDGNIVVSGIVRQPLLLGNMNIKNGSFKMDMTGMRYNFLADLSTNDQRLNFQNVKIFYSDEPEKIMNMKGYLDLSNLELHDLDLALSGDIKLLDKSVSKNVLGIYGELYGRSGYRPLSIKGNPERMDLTGAIQLTKGRIYIPPFKKEAYSLYSDGYTYKILFDSASYSNHNLELFVNKMKDSLKLVDKKRLDPFDSGFLKKNVEVEITSKKDIYFHYDLTISTQDKIFTNLIIDDKTGQEFFGNVTTTLNFSNNEKDSLTVRGRVDLGDNAVYKFYKNFAASGYVQFTGNITNPDLYIDGLYSTTTRDPNDPNATREVIIKLSVRGQTLKPNPPKWEVTVNGSPMGGADPSEEAISFIIFGKFKDELSAEQRINLVSSVGANVGSTFASSYLSNVIQNYLPFIVNTDINYVDNQGGNLAQNTDIRFTAEIGYATIRFGGQVFKDLSNTNFTIEYPINKLWKFNKLSNNLIFQFERVVDPYSENSNVITGTSRTGGLIFYRIKF
jgi:hypothetical protein